MRISRNRHHIGARRVYTCIGGGVQAGAAGRFPSVRTERSSASTPSPEGAGGQHRRPPRGSHGVARCPGREGRCTARQLAPGGSPPPIGRVAAAGSVRTDGACIRTVRKRESGLNERKETFRFDRLRFSRRTDNPLMPNAGFGDGAAPCCYRLRSISE